MGDLDFYANIIDAVGIVTGNEGDDTTTCGCLDEEGGLNNVWRRFKLNETKRMGIMNTVHIKSLTTRLKFCITFLIIKYKKALNNIFIV